MAVVSEMPQDKNTDHVIHQRRRC